MRRVLSGLCFISTACVAQAAPGDQPDIPRGTPYAQARAALIRSGYEAGPMWAEQSKSRCSPGRDECDKYFETLGCSGTGLSYCTFLFTKGPKGYIVRTYGEDGLYDGMRPATRAESKTLVPPSKD